MLSLKSRQKDGRTSDVLLQRREKNVATNNAEAEVMAVNAGVGLLASASGVCPCSRWFCPDHHRWCSNLTSQRWLLGSPEVELQPARCWCQHAFFFKKKGKRY